jgi:hypothetical protein
MADNEWMPVSVERGGHLYGGAYQIEGDHVAVTYQGSTQRAELGSISAQMHARSLLGEMVERTGEASAL